jgi:hypothetical protein
VTAQATADSERYRRFGEEIDAIRDRAVARVGEADVKRVKRLSSAEC